MTCAQVSANAGMPIYECSVEYETLRDGAVAKHVQITQACDRERGSSTFVREAQRQLFSRVHTISDDDVARQSAD